MDDLEAAVDLLETMTGGDAALALPSAPSLLKPPPPPPPKTKAVKMVRMEEGVRRSAKELVNFFYFDTRNKDDIA